MEKMVQSKVIEGTGEELEMYLHQRPKQRFRLVALPPIDEEAEPLTSKALTPEEKIRALDALAEMNRDLPGLPDEAFDREKLYEDIA